MKIKDSSTEVWPELDDAHQSPLLPATTHQIDNSSVKVDMNNLMDTSSSRKDDSHQQTTTS